MKISLCCLALDLLVMVLALETVSVEGGKCSHVHPVFCSRQGEQNAVGLVRPAKQRQMNASGLKSLTWLAHLKLGSTLEESNVIFSQ